MELAKFAASHKTTSGLTPWLETIEEWPEILKAWQAGVGIATIRAWLTQDRGYDPSLVTEGRVGILRKYPRG